MYQTNFSAHYPSRLQAAIGINFLQSSVHLLLHTFSEVLQLFLGHVIGHRKRSPNTALNMTFAWLQKNLCLQPEEVVSIGLQMKFWGESDLFLITGITVWHCKNLRWKCCVSWISVGVPFTTKYLSHSPWFFSIHQSVVFPRFMAIEKSFPYLVIFCFPFAAFV